MRKLLPLRVRLPGGLTSGHSVATCALEQSVPDPVLPIDEGFRDPMQLLAVPMASSGGSGFTLLLPLILIVGMIWFMSRTQRKQRAASGGDGRRARPGHQGDHHQWPGRHRRGDRRRVRDAGDLRGRARPGGQGSGRTGHPETRTPLTTVVDTAEDEPARIGRTRSTYRAGRRDAGRGRRQGAGRAEAAADPHRELISPSQSACGAAPGVHETLRRARKHKVRI